MKELRLGFVGLDTSHVEGLAALLNDTANPEHVPGARVVAGFPGGSPDFPLSINRVADFTAKLRDRYGLEILGSPLEVATAVDAVLHTTVDGGLHLAQFSEMAPLRKPVFIDKPLATTWADAQAIAATARIHHTPVFSSSSLRFAGAFRAALADDPAGRVIGGDFFGPLQLQPTQPGFFWYGIHCAEALYATLGPGCERVRVASTPDHDVAVGVWRDGRIGVIRGNRSGNTVFCGAIHRERGSQWFDASTGRRGIVGLTEAIVAFFRGGPPPVPLDETLEIIRFLEAANESRDRNGCEVTI